MSPVKFSKLQETERRNSVHSVNNVFSVSACTVAAFYGMSSSQMDKALKLETNNLAQKDSVSNDNKIISLQSISCQVA